MTYRYPHAQIQDVDWFGATLGTFFRDYYTGPPTVREWSRLLVREYEQLHAQLQTLFDACDRRRVPVFRREEWSTFELLESQLGGAEASQARYGDGYLYNEPPEIYYGQAVEARQLVVAVPSTLRRCPLLASDAGEGAVWLVEGVDYRFDRDDSTIEFVSDPFENSGFRVETLFSGGEASDRRILLQLYGAEYEDETIWKQFGYAYRMRFPSSAEYRDLLNAVADASVRGASELHARSVIAAAYGAPLARYSGEVVQEVGTDSRGPYVATDRSYYRLPLGSTSAWAVDETLQEGDSLCEELAFDSLNRGVPPEWLSGLSLGRGFISEAAFWGELYFQAEETPLIVEEDVDGYTKVSFALGGHPADVEAFWEEVHRRGIAAGQTLAHLLDLRSAPEDEPKAFNLPTSIVPLDFLTENLLRSSVLLVRVALPSLGERGLGLHALRWLRSVLPPDLCVLILSSRRVADAVDPDSVGEDPETFTTTVATDAVSPSLVGETVRLRSVAGRCI